jgi:hypothetical protein
MNECHPCPDNIVNPDCQYRKEFARLVLRMKLMDDLIGNSQKTICECKK